MPILIPGFIQKIPDPISRRARNLKVLTGRQRSKPAARIKSRPILCAVQSQNLLEEMLRHPFTPCRSMHISPSSSEKVPEDRGDHQGFTICTPQLQSPSFSRGKIERGNPISISPQRHDRHKCRSQDRYVDGHKSKSNLEQAMARRKAHPKDSYEIEQPSPKIMKRS
ncbi:hypothetical protein POX_d06032 [Penicillium oxalicum]|nr:hypothetical protein POX_d06032 [Penicillium oxalicum]KAI2790515.1 hypothetical protein POX_d06032 [Penicillium oxalicum]